MADLEAAIQALTLEATKQGDSVRALKAQKAEKTLITEEVEKLKAVKAELATLMKQQADEQAAAGGGKMNKETFRKNLSSTLEQNMFYMPSFKIYGGVGGLYDYGPTGAAIKANLQAFWRQHFVLEENMLEIECPAVTPYPVLKASGHVDRFIDLMVKDVVTGACYRADHLLKDVLEAKIEETADAAGKKALELTLAHLDEFGAEELGAELKKYNTKAPETGNELSDPYPFNLMFATQIGPSGMVQGFLRPETAQGIFVNFRDLLYFNGSKLPFAAAQIGQSFRNEIAPRAGLLRVREFTQMEIEHFVDPDNKKHKKFGHVRPLTFLMYPRAQQMEASGAIELNMGQAVDEGIIANETLGYFIARTYLYLVQAGIDHKRLRFRQHLQHEMAHYACDCWDAEVQTSYGWIECVGLADRSAFDLDAHSKAAGVDLTAFQKYDKPIETDVLKVEPSMKDIGKDFGKTAAGVKAALLALSDDAKSAMAAELAAGGASKLGTEAGEVEVLAKHVTIKQVKQKISGKTFTPGVIEPSFGIGRIIYCLYEHSYYTREGDDQRSVFKFTPVTAPVKATVFPLLQKPEFEPYTQRVGDVLTRAGVARKVDETGASIGKRYARTDEIGVPFAITIDHTTFEDDTVTLRERDSMAQVRVPIADVGELLQKLCNLSATWEADVLPKYPAHGTTADQ
uniref:glycine--tRNA ligase n=1 Tax=Pyramimonas obovata TaxID=1411642 RepID=A0A7S0QZS9_9CHLO|mmetsp:Transcript_20165/g.44164  ORF Transcript_20165/g.44164 Transcript_20165/m.44164 type:complete len:684 (+) Transcript_20165:43-2094(+)|eukprot:CAMPEP_0118922368 /NCGR_PEP_ID=MMETSP1169-20130426/1318_1 /TAXON_ID=36882 /ORGANISM="Pyramimonas obovata, Strain CCMP722" /LENGTH=683 /DNA_ID=CAMNT_0006863223 /DNA_START=40 /DNA_END=2091 /DNA_ORIENTATION=+